MEKSKANVQGIDRSTTPNRQNNIESDLPMVTYRNALQVLLVQSGFLAQDTVESQTGTGATGRQWKFIQEEIVGIPGVTNFNFNHTYGSIDEAVDYFSRAVEKVDVQTMRAA